MRRAQQFFGIRSALVVLEAARKAVRIALQRGGFGADLALAVLALAFPVHSRFLVAHVDVLSRWPASVPKRLVLPCLRPSHAQAQNPRPGRGGPVASGNIVRWLIPPTGETTMNTQTMTPPNRSAWIGTALGRLALTVGLVCAAAALLAGPGYRMHALSLNVGIQTMRWAATFALGAAVAALLAALMSGVAGERRGL